MCISEKSNSKMYSLELSENSRSIGDVYCQGILSKQNIATVQSFSKKIEIVSDYILSSHITMVTSKQIWMYEEP